ncbi:MAG: tetratricopeptide repeat protein [Bacteroidaceae bacterium]|nr:tetratricopeptide repeat protein [Bacteroidaceae bacterium]
MSNIEDTRFQVTDERIERFLRGQMTTEEEASFREDLRSDSELCEHARAISALLKGLQEKGKQQDQKIIDEVTAQKKPSNIRRLIIWTSSIAAAIILVFGYKFYAENSRYARVNAMLSPYYVQYDLDELSRGETDSVTISHLYTLFNRISEEKDMKEIIAELEPIYESLDSDFTYYPYANDITWNLALAYVKAGNKEKAISVLETIVRDNEDSPIAAKAKALIQTLESSK